MALDLTISPHQRGYTRYSVEGREEGRRPNLGGMNKTGRMFLLMSSDHSQITCQEVPTANAPRQIVHGT